MAEFRVLSYGLPQVNQYTRTIFQEYQAYTHQFRRIFLVFCKFRIIASLPFHTFQELLNLCLGRVKASLLRQDFCPLQMSLNKVRLEFQ